MKTNNMKKYLILTLAALLALSSPISRAQADGPYIIYRDSSARVITVDTEGKISDLKMDGIGPGSTFKVISDNGSFSFDVTLHEISRPQWKYESPGKTFIMSDPHGNLDCVVSLLRGNGIIDDNLNWSFGSNHLVIIGDIFDRGDDATQIFWLVYKLEEEARQAGGVVSFQLGNHEPMVLSGDLRYTNDKYKALADTLGCAFPSLMGADTELGRWLGTRNTMLVIGDDIYVHAGLSGKFLEKRLSVPQVNERISGGLFLTKEQRKEDPELYFLFKSYGPIWYRGLICKEKKYHPSDESTLDAVLDWYGVKRVFVGHTIIRKIKSFYGGKVIGVNVSNQENRAKGRSRAVLIDGGITYAAGDKGIIKRL